MSLAADSISNIIIIKLSSMVNVKSIVSLKIVEVKR
jgi:hypothetical protein